MSSFKLAHRPFIQILQRNTLPIVVNLQNRHLFSTIRTGKRIVPEGNKDRFPPSVKRHKESLFFRGSDTMQLFILFPMTGIQPIVTDHFEILFRYVLHEKLDEIHCGNGHFYIGIVFVAVIVECNCIIVFVIIILLSINNFLFFFIRI